MKKGSRWHSFLMKTLYVVLGVLFYWFLGFLMDDISNQPGPELTEIQKKYQDQVIVKDKENNNKQLKILLNRINENKQQQTILQTSINSYRDTMNQLLDLQKASIQKGITFSPESQKNLQDVTALYLDYQNRFQDLNNSVTKDNLTAQQLQNSIREMDVKLNLQNEEATKEYDALWVKHNWLMAGLQLLVLIPLLLITAYLYSVHKQSVYRPMIMTIGIAVFLKISFVMHDYFPSYLFKYLLILALIYITILTLIKMIRMITAPKPAYLQTQYKEAYQSAQCPICQYPIKPNIAKFISLDKKSNMALSDFSYLDHVDTYSCPSCGEHLFEKCGSCSHVRHSLLGYCDNCGVKKEIVYSP